MSTDNKALSSLRGIARDAKISRCQWCGNYTRKPCLCPAAVEIDRLTAECASGSALERFAASAGHAEPDPVERLRFFCSLAMDARDWFDAEPFFDDVLAAATSAADHLAAGRELVQQLVACHDEPTCPAFDKRKDRR